jgi:hypothetical protein
VDNERGGQLQYVLRTQQELPLAVRPVNVGCHDFAIFRQKNCIHSRKAVSSRFVQSWGGVEERIDVFFRLTGIPRAACSFIKWNELSTAGMAT